MSRKLSTGKQPATEDDRDLALLDVLELKRARAKDFGHYDLVDAELYDFDVWPWGMLGNDSAGDCVFAGFAHQQALDQAEGGRPAPTFTDAAVLSDYSAVTGFTKGKPSTDKGTNVREALGYRRSTGIVDGDGKRHKIGVYAALPAADVEATLNAARTLGKVGIGFEVPSFAMGQFNAGEPFDVQPGKAQIEGGHFVVVVGQLNGYIVVVTWGTLALMTPAFFEQYVDEAWAYLTGAQINPKTGESLAGLDVEKLRAFERGL